MQKLKDNQMEVTSKQEGLVDEFMTKLNNNEMLLCKPIINYLLGLQYKVKKRKKSTFVIEFEKYGRIIVKLEHGKTNKTDPAPYLKFYLRFSASNKYTKLFQEAVNRRPEAWIKRNQYWQPKDHDCCGLCHGKPRFYHYISENGTRFDGCGGYTKWVPDVSLKNVPEILKMIREQDVHFQEIMN